MSKKVRYIGGSDERTLSEDDMLALGVEDHPGLWFTSVEPVIEFEEDEVADAVLTLRTEFKLEPTDEQIVEEEIGEKSRDDLVAEAEGLGLVIKSKMTKEDIAGLIVDERDRLASQNPPEGTGAVPSANEGAQVEPTA